MGAKFTGSNFAPDEYLNEQPSLTLSFDGKRDRWNGYDPSTHEDVVEDYVKMEELRKRMKKEKMTKKDVDPTEVRFLCYVAFNAEERGTGKKLDTETQMYIEDFLFAVP